MLKIAAFLALLAAATAVTTYDGHKVYRLLPASDVHYNFLQKAVAGNVGVSLWTELRKGNGVDVMVSPKAQRLFHLRLHDLGIEHKVIIEDVQEGFDRQMAENELARKMKSRASEGRMFDHTYYRTLSELYQAMDQLENSYPDLFSSYYATNETTEGRSIRIMKASNGIDREAIFFDCGIHAREWVSQATCLYILDSLSEGDVSYLDSYDFHIAVAINPDGYEYTWTDDRMWRKNRHFFPGGGLAGQNCTGVDPNRNFDSNFGGDGAADGPCADTYHGPSAFSEAESQAAKEALIALASKVKIAFSIHAYSQLWMTPYGYTEALPADYDNMLSVANVGVAALKAVNGTTFQAGNIAQIIYVASGGSVDWYYDKQNIIYSYALELRDTGKFGFSLPADQIEITAEETWTGIKAAIDAINAP